MTNIFISYRREETTDITGRIYDRLVNHFGQKQIFKDVDNIPAGVNFRTYLDHLIGESDVVLVIIGQKWAELANATGRRLESPSDPVRTEIEVPMSHDLPIIPVLVHGATMPMPPQLPASLASFVDYQACTVRADPDFHHNVDHVIAEIDHTPIRQRDKWKLNWNGVALLLLLAIALLGFAVNSASYSVSYEAEARLVETFWITVVVMGFGAGILLWRVRQAPGRWPGWVSWRGLFFFLLALVPLFAVLGELFKDDANKQYFPGIMTILLALGVGAVLFSAQVTTYPWLVRLVGTTLLLFLGVNSSVLAPISVISFSLPFIGGLPIPFLPSSIVALGVTASVITTFVLMVRDKQWHWLRAFLGFCAFLGFFVLFVLTTALSGLLLLLLGTLTANVIIKPIVVVGTAIGVAAPLALWLACMLSFGLFAPQKRIAGYVQ